MNETGENALISFYSLFFLEKKKECKYSIISATHNK